MANENKKFNYGLYAVAVFVIVTIVIVLITLFTFKSKYIAFDEEKVAVNYTDTIIQKGDGYNAYKFTLVSKDEKYGDFIRHQYMYPIIYPGYEAGMDDDAFDELKKNGYDTDEHKSDTTKNDDGSLAGQLADTMYPYYAELVETYGWDNYDAIFSNYFSKFVEVRAQIFGDDYLNDEVMFTAFESNVAAYGDNLTGTKAVTDEDSGITTGEDKVGFYQTKFGDDYKISETVSNVEQVDADAYKDSLDADTLAVYGISSDDISDAVAVTVDVTLEDGTVISQSVVNEVKIGNSWYVDNTNVDTSALYLAK